MIQPPNFHTFHLQHGCHGPWLSRAFQIRLIHLGPGVAEPLHHLQVPPCCCDAQRGDAEAILQGAWKSGDRGPGGPGKVQKCGNLGIWRIWGFKNKPMFWGKYERWEFR